MKERHNETDRERVSGMKKTQRKEKVREGKKEADGGRER